MYKHFLHRLTALILVLMTFLSASCDNDDAEEIIPEPTPHTMLFYFIGTDLSTYYTRNITAAGKGLAKLTEPGGALENEQNKSRVLCFIQRSNTTAELIELEYKEGLCEQKVLASYDIPTVMTAARLSEHLKDMIEFAPATSYGLVVGSHSRAWTLIDSPDFEASLSQYSTGKSSITPYWERDPEALVTRFIGEGYPFFKSYSQGCSNYFDIPDFASALSDTGVKFEYTIYDACLMANVETVYDLRHTSKYIIASVVEIMGNGFPYDSVIPHLINTNGKSFDLNGVCQAFYQYYLEGTGYSGSVSLIDCSELDNLAALTKIINKNTNNTIDTSTLQYYDGLRPHLFFDYGQYMKALCTDQELLSDLQHQLDKAIPYKLTLNKFYTGLKPLRGLHAINPDAYSGLSTSQPSEMYRTEYETTAWYKATH